MATPAEIQAQIDHAGTGRVANITLSTGVDATYDNHYVVGQIGYSGRSRWVRTTKSDDAETQAAAILAALSS